MPGYGAPGYPAPSVIAVRRTNRMAVAAMIVALAALIVGGSIKGLPGLIPLSFCLVGAILGHIALRRIRQTGERGKGFAITGITVGWIGTSLLVLVLGLLLLYFVAGGR
jgi:hypothetical protein